MTRLAPRVGRPQAAHRADRDAPARRQLDRFVGTRRGDESQETIAPAFCVRTSTALAVSSLEPQGDSIRRGEAKRDPRRLAPRPRSVEPGERVLERLALTPPGKELLYLFERRAMIDGVECSFDASLQGVLLPPPITGGQSMIRREARSVFSGRQNCPVCAHRWPIHVCS